jgi:hypothetical protein
MKLKKQNSANLELTETEKPEKIKYPSCVFCDRPVKKNYLKDDKLIIHMMCYNKCRYDSKDITDNDKICVYLNLVNYIRSKKQVRNLKMIEPVKDYDFQLKSNFEEYKKNINDIEKLQELINDYKKLFRINKSINNF